jgi:hypothetical protein
MTSNAAQIALCFGLDYIRSQDRLVSPDGERSFIWGTHTQYPRRRGVDLAEDQACFNAPRVFDCSHSTCPNDIGEGTFGILSLVFVDE